MRKIRPVSVVNGICYIPLSQGKVATCDESDYHLVAFYNWHCWNDGKTFYVARSVTVSPHVYTEVLLHRHILSVDNSKIEVDHRDGNGLNNCRSNLRVCSKSQNLMNASLSVDSASGYKGVNWHKHVGKWCARIEFSGKRVSLGYFDDKELAAKAYDKAVVEYHGDFGKRNEVMVGV